jgi:hypothetical protein
MDVGRFLALFSHKALYFSRKHDLDDKWEGVVPPLGVRRAVCEIYRSEENARFVGDSVLETGEAVAARAVVSCWHANGRESVAMWRLYTSGAEGVAIQTTVGRLKNAFEQEPCSVTIARVRYIDHLSEDLGLAWALDPLSPLFCKRRGFEHEQEVRCVIANPEDEREQALWLSELRPELRQQFPVLGQWEEVIDGDLGECGLPVPVNLRTLIERIVVSPRYPAWAIPALQEIVDRADLGVRVETSSLLDQPPRPTTVGATAGHSASGPAAQSGAVDKEGKDLKEEQ